MQIDRRITNGLAWAGVLLVVGVPTADLLSAQLFGDAPRAANAQVAAIDVDADAPVPVPLSQRPKGDVAAVAPTAQTASVVDKFTQSGKALPSYITDAPAAAKPAQVATAPAVPVKPAAQPQVAATTPPTRTPIITTPVDPVQTASIPPKIAPMPMPLSMRPAPVAVAAFAPASTASVTVTRNEPIVLPSSIQPIPPAEVTAEDLDDWETGPLADFLARREGRQPQQAEIAPAYSDDDYYYDRGQEFQQQDRLIGPAPSFFPFAN